MALEKMNLNLHMMMVTRNIQQKKHLKVLLTIQKDVILKQKVSGKEKKFRNTKANPIVKNARV